MSSLYDERRKNIKLESHAAKKLLFNNLQEFKLSDLISFGAGSITGAMKGAFDEPNKVISGGDMISRTILPKGNFIRTIFRVLSSMKRIFKIFVK